MFRSQSHRRVKIQRSPLGSRRSYAVERLEARELLAADGLGAADPVAQPLAHFSRYSSPLSPYSQTPDMIRHAYGFDQVADDGAGKTIAIVDAYGDSNIANDLSTFDKTFSTSTYWGGNAAPADFTRSPSTFFKKLDQNGGTRYPSNNSGWALETALDVEWAHAMAPGASILLVEAKSASTSDLLKAVDTASAQPGVVAVSMSWGASEFAGETADDFHFNHAGISYVAASGDTGGQVIWPSASPNVLSVGGTTLTTNWPAGETNKNGPFDYEYEIGWQDSGGGASAYETQPAWQTMASGISTTHRVTPDVAYDADPGSGVAVYSSLNSGWSEVGGTSAGAPQWAALTAVADQARSTPLTNLPADVYGLAEDSASNAYALDFHDVTVVIRPDGTVDFPTGYDTVTGIGSPQANNLVPALAGLTSEPAANNMLVTGGAAGGSAQVTVEVVTAVASAAAAPLSTAEASPSSPTAILPPASDTQATDAALAAYDYPSVDDGTLAALARGTR